MEVAAIMAIALANGGGKPPDWKYFIGIITFLVIKSTISFIEENNVGNASASLMAQLAPKENVLRDGRWSEEDVACLVLGDILSIKLGDIIPANAQLLEGDPLKIDQSALTRESLPMTKNLGNGVCSGSTRKQGKIKVLVIATVGMIIEIIVQCPTQHQPYRLGIDNLLVLLIGGIPIAIPTIISVTMAIGSHCLSQQGAITKRMTAIEEMDGMDVLYSDKTGTLTLNKLTMDKNLIDVFAKGD